MWRLGTHLEQRSDRVHLESGPANGEIAFWEGKAGLFLPYMIFQEGHCLELADGIGH